MGEMESRVEDFAGRRVWAVVGVSSDPSKYGHRVFATLLRAGYEVYGVSVKGGEVLGHRIQTSLAELPVVPEVVSIVVPPRATEEIVRQCAALGIARVWMQPGAESEAATEFCRANGIAAVWGQCILMNYVDWP